MTKPSNVVSAAHFLKWPDDEAEIPVLTDVLVMASDAHGRTLWLAWDERRLPVLQDEVADEQALPRWARRRV